MAPREIIVDQYSALSHKPLVGLAGDTSVSTDWRAPTWVPNGEHRRLRAYIARAAYQENVARLLLSSSMSDAERANWREYGDASLLTTRVAAAVLGDNPQITAAGADDDLLDGPDLPEEPESLPDGASEFERRIYDGRLAVWTGEVERLIDAWEQAVATQPAARAAQVLLREWADGVQLPARLLEATDTSVGLGDAVIVLSPRPGRMPAVTVYEGGFYFPELPDDASIAYPDTVHLAWEEDRTDGLGRTERWVRRLTWQLVDLTSQRVVEGRDGLAWLGPDGEPGDRPELGTSESMVDGRIVRRLPWHQDDDEPATRTCMYSDGAWRLSDVQDRKVDALDDARAVWATPPLDLRIDFLPVIHLPGSPEGSRHYGRSVIDRAAQLLDDVATNDSNIASASAYLGDPTIALSGAKPPESGMVAPGKVYGTGEHGRMDVLDLSAGLPALLSAGDRLLDRLSETTGVVGEVIGRSRGDTATSGIHLLLRLAPWAQLIGSIRLGHGPKLRLLPKMAHRMGQIAGAIDEGPTPDVAIQFGAFLPSDLAGAVELVAKGLDAHAISVETAVTVLIAAGMPIEDAALEIRRIVAQDTERLNALADALAGVPGLAEIIAERAGVQVAADTAVVAPPVIELDPVEDPT